MFDFNNKNLIWIALAVLLLSWNGGFNFGGMGFGGNEETLLIVGILALLFINHGGFGLLESKCK